MHSVLCMDLASSLIGTLSTGCPVYQGGQHAGVPGEHAQVHLQGDVLLLGGLTLVQALLQVSNGHILNGAFNRNRRSFQSGTKHL